MTTPLLVDSHCHLNYTEFADLDAVITRANDAGVGVMQTICTQMSEYETVLALAKKHPALYASVGVHPNNVNKAPLVTFDALYACTQDAKIIGIGETGLDYYYEHSDRKLQQESFRVHMQVASRSGLPVIVHTRSADDDTLTQLKETMKETSFPGLIHCFGSSQAFADEVLELGLYISISGIITFKNAQPLRDVVKNIPLNRLLVETDAPYLAPVPHRGKSNEPAFTKYTATCIAEIKGITYEEVAEATTNNFFQLFTKAIRL